jgi:hypothetical protein
MSISARILIFKLCFVGAMWITYGVLWFQGIIVPGAGAIIMVLASILVLTD